MNANIKRIVIHKKIIFTTIITITALVCTQKSFGYLIDNETGQHITTAVPIGSEKYTLSPSSQPFDLVENRTDQPITIILSADPCLKIKKDIPANHMLEIPLSPLEIKLKCHRKRVQVAGAYGVKAADITTGYQANGWRRINIGSIGSIGGYPDPDPFYTININ